MPARLGPGGPEAFAALDAIEADFGQKVLQDAATLVDGAAAAVSSTADLPAPNASDLLRGQLASTGAMGAALPPGPAAPPLEPAAIDISVFASTGFTVNALMSLFAGIVRRAAEPGQGTIPRQEHFTSETDGLRQEVDLSSTVAVEMGGGRASGDISMSATDRISKPDGTFVALYTSTAAGHFDVNACPDGGGIGEGTYSFKTKHELNDLGGGGNVQSGAGHSIGGPFKLVNGDDAKLQRVEASLETNANASGSGGEASPGSMALSSAMAQLFLEELGREAERFWRSGACIELKPNPDSKTVEPEEKVELTVDSKAKFGDHADVKGPIVAKFSGKKSLDPHDQPQDAPAKFAFEAGTEEGDIGTIDLEQTSRRGIGKRQVKYTVGGGLKLSLTSKGTPNLATVIKSTWQGTIKDLKLTHKDDAYEGQGQIKETLTFTLSATGAKCTGSKSKTYDVSVKAVPVADMPDQLDLSFDYAPGAFELVTITCKTKEGTASMPAPWGGLLEVLPPPGDVRRVTIDATTQIRVPPSITISLTVRREKKT